MPLLQRSQAVTETSQIIGIPLLDAKNDDGSAVAAAAAAGKFGIVSGGFGTGGTKLQGEAANNNTKTSTVKYTVRLPQNYVAGTNFNIRIAQRVSVICNTTANIDANCYKSDLHGGVGADQCTTTIITNNTTSWVNHTFAVTGTSFSPGDELDIYIQCQANDTGGANNGKSEVGSVYLECSTQM